MWVEANIAMAWNCMSSWSQSTFETCNAVWEWLACELVEAFTNFTVSCEWFVVGLMVVIARFRVGSVMVDYHTLRLIERLVVSGFTEIEASI